MKYYKSSKAKISYLLLLVFSITLISSLYVLRGPVYRSIVTINLGSLKVDYMNSKANFLSSIRGANLETVSVNMSPNNFVKMNKERSSMVNSFILGGSIWDGKNQYYKARFINNISETKSEVKLFGMNTDHFRNPNSHSFRVKYDGKTGFGKKTVNFLNPRSRDFITDPLLNIIYSKLYNGIRINYFPYRVYFNKVNFGIFYSEDFFDKYLIEQNNRRESVIFEIANDSIDFNYLGEDDSFYDLGNELSLLFKNDYNKFLKKIDLEKLKAVIKLSLIANSAHSLEDINLHWYYNPVTDLFEPTIRETWATNFSNEIENDLPRIYMFEIENDLINDMLTDNIKQDITNELINEIDDIRNILLNDQDYISLKNQMVGYADKISIREKILLENLNLLEEDQLQINDQQKLNFREIFHITKDTIIKGEFIVTHNQKMIIHEGVTLRLDGAYLKVYGGFEANGTKKKPISIEGINKQGTLFFNTDQKVTIKNIIFNNLNNTQSGFDQPAAITFYECKSVNISNTLFKSNKSGDDYVNFFRSENIILKDSKFQNILNDAVDSDFSKIVISNTEFTDIGNDAIDSSGSDIKVENSLFYLVMDKAISAGEKSHVNVNQNIFKNNEIALVSKDQSLLTSNNNRFIENTIDIASFMKKSFYDYPKIIIKNSRIGRYLIEQGSLVQGIDSILYTNDVESKLYGNLYGRASD